MRVHAWRIYLAIGVLISIAAWVLPEIATSVDLASRITCYEVLSASAFAAIVVGLRWHRPEVRLPWLLFAGSQLVYFTADVTFYAYHHVLHNESFPAPADGL